VLAAAFTYKRSKEHTALHGKPNPELQGINCHPTQVNAPDLTAANKLVLVLHTLEGWKAELT